MKKFLSVVCAIVLCMGLFAGCAPDSDPGGGAGGQAGVWTAYSTRKILQNRQDLYEGETKSQKLSVFAAKGEYESGQIILSAGSDTAVYTVKTEDLAGNGNVFSASNISVYHEKYTEVARNYENTSAPPGMYPDALLPYETAVLKGENEVKAGENQGLYITFRIPSEQPAGVYTGSVGITFGEQSFSVPVELEVCGFEIAEEVHSKSIFLTEWDFASGELNSTQEMLDAYTEKLIEYRLAPHYVITDSAFTKEDAEYYADKASEYLVDPACSNISIPYTTRIVNGQTCIDTDVFAEYLRAFAEKSFELNFDLCAKLTCYFNILDEPHLTGATERVKVVQTEFAKIIGQVASEIENGDGDAALKESVAASVRNLKSVVTCPYDASLAGYIDTWCPTVDQYDYLSDLYADQEEKWWYTCNNPKVPYPTLHTEDTLLSARVMGWMMTEYDITGNLYWATNIYATYEDGAYKPLEDYFASASHFPNVNGDGYLFYPGGQYGLDTPLATVRLEALRDGLEEFEIGYFLKENYARLPAADKDGLLDGIYRNITSGLYSGTRVATTDEAFAAARRELYDVAELAACEANVCFTDFTDDDYGHLTYEIYAKKGYTLKNDGNAIAPSSVTGEYNVYELVFDLSEGENRIALTVECGGKTYGFEKYLGGTIDVYGAEDLQGGFSSADGAPVAAEPAAAPDGSGESWLKIEVGQAPENKWQNFKWSGSLVSGLGVDTERLVLHLYYGGDAPLSVALSAKYEKNAVISDVVKFTLKKGMNTVEIANMDAFNWDRTGCIEYFVFYLGDEKNNPDDSVIYFANVVEYGV